ncbi:hypothetical protein Q3G72_024381 [Acer saccharum]|nr:hypothetical protein Q3G72_024381 [Acer saccharum]
MKEHQDSTAEDARKHAVGKISDAWKGLNKECLSPNPFSTSFTRASLNLARMVPLMYGYDDNQRLPILEQYIKSLLHEKKDTVDEIVRRIKAGTFGKLEGIMPSNNK